MFGLGDNFDIDEDFLGEVFQVEEASQAITREGRRDASRNSVRTRSNILTESVGNCDFEFGDGASSFSLSGNLSEHGLASVRSSITVGKSTSRDCDPRKVQARKFPGPAGLLPQRQSNTSLIATEDFLNELEEELREDALCKEEEEPSQDNTRRLESPAWAKLSKDLGDDCQNLLSRLNVASVCSRAKLTRALKIPFLALLIQNVDASTSDPCLYLSDPTGEMVGAVHRELWEQLGEDLVAGAVIVLINVGVLSAGVTSSRHYLNITSNNIATVYSPTDGRSVRVTNVKPLSQPECSKFLRTWQELLSSQERPSPELVRPLFSTASFTSSSSSPRRHPSFSNRTADPSGGDCSFEISFAGPLASHSPFRNRNDPSPNTLINNFSPIGQPSKLNRVPPPKSNPQTMRLKLNPRLPSVSSPQLIDTAGFQSRSNHKPIKVTCDPHSESKRPRFDSSNGFSATVVSSQDLQNQSVVESLLDGIDADSLFGDF